MDTSGLEPMTIAELVPERLGIELEIAGAGDKTPAP